MAPYLMSRNCELERRILSHAKLEYMGHPLLFSHELAFRSRQGVRVSARLSIIGATRQARLRGTKGSKGSSRRSRSCPSVTELNPSRERTVSKLLNSP
jgi:hypothetical protein